MKFISPKTAYILCGFLGLLALGAGSTDKPLGDFENLPVWVLAEKFGQKKLYALNPKIKGVSVERGRDLVHKGQTVNEEGQMTSKQSKYFVCTSCHNVAKDEPSLTVINPQARLDYAARQNLPLLPANSFYGMVNRTTFYNDDYQKKYGHVKTIAKAKSDLRQAIQVCATECSQGRALEEWELEAILAYMWTLELKVSDLNLNEADRASLEAAYKGEADAKAAAALLDKQYLKAYPAHFIDPPEFKPLTDVELGDKKRYENGRKVYEMSCKHCHSDKRYAKTIFDNKQTTFEGLYEKLLSKDPHSITNAIRKGIPANEAKSTSYMPQYTAEHLSNEQLLDLRIYVENMARYGGISATAETGKSFCSEKPVTYQDVKTLLNEKCVNCHNSMLAPDFSTYQSMQPSLKEGSFDIRVFIRKDMPIGQRLSAEELRILECWKNGGFKEN